MKLLVQNDGINVLMQVLVHMLSLFVYRGKLWSINTVTVNFLTSAERYPDPQQKVHKCRSLSLISIA